MSNASVLPGSLVDTHAHLDDARLKADLEGVLFRAREAGVAQIVAIGTAADDSEAVAELAQRRSGIFAAVGLHPNDLTECRPGDWDRIQALTNKEGVVAIGETGLDRYRDNTPFDLQVEWFDRHLELAFACDLPVVIHCRNSESDILERLERLGRPTRGILHSFTGNWEQARAFLELGLHLSFAGMVTFENKSLNALREVTVRVPADRILVETDSPYLSPHPYRGQSNEPQRVATTAAALAALRGVSLAEFAMMTTNNARRLFRIPENHRL